MLAKTYRFVAQNNTGVALASTDSITITAIRKSFSTTGFGFETAQSTELSGGSLLASAAFLVGATIDNSATGWEFGDFVVSATITTATPTGTVSIWYQVSTDGGTTWAINGLGIPMVSLGFTATGTQTTNFSIE